MAGNGFKKAYLGLVRGENFLGSFLLLLIRVYWGGMLVITGLAKWMNASGVAEFFADLGIPAPLFMVYLVGAIELVGGLSLFLGLFARITTIPLIVIFIVAYVTAHPEALVQFLAAPSVFIEASPFLYLYASLIVFCFGSGFISLDYWIEKRAYGEGL